MPSSPPPDTESPAQRRWQPSAMRVGVVGALALLSVAFFFPQARVVALGGLAVLALAAFLPSRRRPPAQMREEERRRQIPLWPETPMKAVVEALPSPAFILDRNLALRYRNALSEKAFGAMALGDSISLRLRSPELLAAIESAVRQSAAERTQYVERGLAGRSWSVDIAPIPAPQGENPYFFLLLFYDRTAEHGVERMRTDFVANASHELRTPLASVLGFIETLQGPAKGDAAARDKFLAVMHDQATRMSRLIDDLMSLSRIEMKRHVPVESSVDLKRLLGEVCEMMSPLAHDLGVSLELEPSSGDYPIVGERDELIQVFSNLIENACKYGQAGQRVVLSLASRRDRDIRYFDVAVRDFGPGIAAEHVPRLTERFYRVDMAHSSAKRGTGLGLSIVRNILVRHRAELLIESEVGRGSTFTVRLRAAATDRVNPEKAVLEQ
ncbi:ATP-binding protein [Consotaella aegiceratis]|uniref:ATP-binding protein n=1 Tax=Consotaella aegiceratis TaxID=3097961 RepID=UPI002F3F37CB